VTRSDRLKAALCALVDERSSEIDAIQALHAVEISMTLDDAGCIDYEVMRYETKRHRRFKPKDRSHVA
jgi:quinol monooxygenase YgiN